MPRTVTSYLQLVRLPNVVTAAADSLAGWLLAMGSFAEPSRWVPLTVASMVLYAAGTTLNDVFDFDIDRAERPNRPLPSGQISRRTAAWCGAIGLLFGPAIALLSGSSASGLVAAILAVCILGYDAGLKHSAFGPLLMGGCRGLNLLLGMTHAAGLAGWAGWSAAIAYGLFVAGITVISRSEVHGGSRKGLVAGLWLENLALLGLAGLALQHRRFPIPAPDRPLIPIEGILVLALIALAVNAAASRAIRQPTPELIQKAVKTGILSLIWLNVGLVAAVRGVGPACIIAALWVPAYLLGRWLYTT
ncbi:MAG: UbiA family prenyltransferase [Isosphaeraceae bacterium]